MSANSAITSRSPPKLIIFTILTLGFYWMYHLYRLNGEFKQATGAGYSPGLRTILFFIPFVNFYAAWQMGQAANQITSDVSPGLGAVGFLVPLVGAFLVQPKLNEVAA